MLKLLKSRKYTFRISALYKVRMAFPPYAAESKCAHLLAYFQILHNFSNVDNVVYLCNYYKFSPGEKKKQVNSNKKIS